MRKKSGNSENRSHSGFVFLVSFIVSLCILGSLFYIFFVYMQARQAQTKPEDIPYISDYHPHISENLTVMLYGCDRAESLPTLTAVIKYDAQQGVVFVVVLPASTVCTMGGRVGSISELYDYGGVYCGIGGVENLLNIKIDGYIRIQRKGVANMADFFGGLPYTIKQEKTVDGQRFFAGEQTLDGRRIASLIFEEVKPGTANPAIQQELIGDLLKRGFNKDLSERFQTLAAAVFYNCETGLSQYDFIKRQTGFTNRLKLDSMVVNSAELKGSYNKSYDKFYPNEQSLSDICELLSPEK